MSDSIDGKDRAPDRYMGQERETLAAIRALTTNRSDDADR